MVEQNGELETLLEPVEEGEILETPKGSEPLQEDRIARIEKSNQGLYERLKRTEDALKITKAELVKKGVSSNLDETDIDTRVELRLAGYSAEEISYMKTYAKGAEKKLAEVKDDPFLQSGIERLREKKKAEQAVPSPSSGSGGTEKLVEFAKLPKEEQHRAWVDTLEKQKRKRLGSLQI